MSVLELKNELHEIVVQVQSEAVLQKILNSVHQIIKEEDLWDLMSEEQIDKLKISIAHSKDKSLLLSHDEVKRKHARWLQQ
jgi:hypothetical protein